MNKKRIFGIVLFFLLGFFVFTFANPKNDNEDINNNDILKPTPAATENHGENNNQKPQNIVQTDINNQEQQSNVQPVMNYQGQSKNGGSSNTAQPVVNPAPIHPEQSLPVEDLTDYRNAAKKEIADYRDSLNLVTSTEKLIETANGQIDAANTKSAIDKVVSDTKDALDKL